MQFARLTVDHEIEHLFFSLSFCNVGLVRRLPLAYVLFIVLLVDNHTLTFFDYGDRLIVLLITILNSNTKVAGSLALSIG